MVWLHILRLLPMRIDYWHYSRYRVSGFYQKSICSSTISDNCYQLTISPSHVIYNQTQRKLLERDSLGVDNQRTVHQPGSAELTAIRSGCHNWVLADVSVGSSRKVCILMKRKDSILDQSIPKIANFLFWKQNHFLVCKATSEWILVIRVISTVVPLIIRHKK